MILNYHEIVSEESPYLYSTTRQRLEEHLVFLAGLKSPMPVTFDDGLASHYCQAAEVLARYSTRGTFFVTASWMSSKVGHMTWEQVRGLLAAGHSIQSHSWSHKMLTKCSATELEDELRKSKHVIEDKLGTAIDAIACPGGRWNSKVLEECAKAGYRRVYTSDPWSGIQRLHGLEVLGRLCVRRTLDQHGLATLLRSEQRPFATERIKYKFRQSVRKVLRESLYHRIWCLLASEDVREEIARSYGEVHSEGRAR